MRAYYSKIARILALISLPAQLLALEPMSVDEMSDVTAREGIRIGLEFRLNADANGDPLIANCGSTSNFSSIGCRMALNFANRDDLGGEWVVLKNMYGILDAPAIYLDASRTPVAATSYVDLDRFRDESGTPLLATPNDIPALALTFPEPIELGMTIGGINVEYGATGYNDDALDPFMGLEIGNSAGGPAVINAEGTMRWYGF